MAEIWRMIVPAERKHSQIQPALLRYGTGKKAHGDSPTLMFAAADLFSML